MKHFNCGAGRPVTLRAVTASAGCDDYFHDDEAMIEGGWWNLMDYEPHDWRWCQRHPKLAAEALDAALHIRAKNRTLTAERDAARDENETLHDANELQVAEIQRLKREAKRLLGVLDEIAGDYGCQLREPADVSQPPKPIEACRDQWRDQPERWCIPCMARYAVITSTVWCDSR